MVLIAENESDLQIMVNELTWLCDINSMSINNKKSNVVHFRPNSVQKSGHDFICCNEIVGIVDKYVYLGLTLSEHLDYNSMTKSVAQSAGRALGLLIAKYKSMGGRPFDVFTKLYDSCV